jgi:hypothetical protein
MAAKRQPPRGPAYWLKMQREFMDERGGNVSGYVAFYAKYGRPAEEAIAIQEADHAKLRELMTAAARGSW